MLLGLSFIFVFGIGFVYWFIFRFYVGVRLLFLVFLGLVLEVGSTCFSFSFFS